MFFFYIKKWIPRADPKALGVISQKINFQFSKRNLRIREQCTCQVIFMDRLYINIVLISV